MLFSHGFVPDNFGAGIIVPLVKDKAGDVNSLDNYRAITLTPIIAKVFESIILDICEVNLATDDLQVGFKRGSGCNDAIFTLKMIINYFTILIKALYSQLHWTFAKPLTVLSIVNSLIRFTMLVFLTM